MRISASVAQGQFTVCLQHRCSAGKLGHKWLEERIPYRLNRRRVAVPQSALHVFAGVDDGQIQREEGLLRRQNPNILPGERAGQGQGREGAGGLTIMNRWHVVKATGEQVRTGSRSGLRGT